MEPFFRSAQPKGNLAGKTVLVTGASSGIGAEVSRHLALEGGANVVMGARRTDRLLELEADICAKGGSAFALSLDVTKEADFSRAFAAAELKYGRVDAVFANAGWMGPFWGDPDMPSSADAERLMDINYFGVRRALSAALKTFRKHGHGGVFVATSSVVAAARRGAFRGVVDYNASKAAIEALVRACADLAPEGIRVYGLLPAVFKSEMSEGASQMLGAPSTDVLAIENPVFSGVACPGELMGPLLRRLIAGDDLPFPPGSGLAVDGPAVFSAQQLYSTLETEERKIDLKQLYDVDLRPMPLTEAERDAMLETLKKAKQAL